MANQMSQITAIALSLRRRLRRFIPLLIICTFILLPACQADRVSPTHLANASFETPNPERPTARPAGWRPYRWGGRGEFGYALTGRTGERSVLLSSEGGADIAWGCEVEVKPFSRYRFSGWICTEDLEVGTGRGALFNLHGIPGAESPPVKGTSDWISVEFEFETGSNDAVQINCLFGGWGSATGSAWYDDLNLELLESIKPIPYVSIDASMTGTPISPYIYGQFIEHLGRCIYGGIWAEIIEDRKFWYRPGDEGSPWRIAGDPEILEMDTRNSFVGEQTPVLALPGDGGTYGLSHAGLGLVTGREYEGHIILAGDTEAAPVEVSLIWGEGSGDRTTFTINSITSDYSTFHFNYTAGASTDDGVLEIISRGSGTLRIGTLSLMPADNVEGFRSDVLDLLRQLDAPVYRWPGGNFVSGYNWKDGIGNRDRRPPRKNPAWQGIEHNDVGIHEFIRLCELINTEPYVTVNTGLGTIKMAAEEVEYCNGSADTPMGRLRVDNGHPEPFGVRWWAVGNEMYGQWQLGHMPVEEYITKHNRTVEAMRSIDPSIRVVAVGSVGRWDKAVMPGSAGYMDLISEHFYCQERPGLLGHTAWAAEHVRRIADAHRGYRERFPELAGRDIQIALDEWNYWYGPHVYGELGTRYFLKDALGIARGLHEYYRNSDIIFMANYAQTVNVIGCIKTSKTESAFATTGLVLKLYRQQYGDIPVEVGGAPEPLDVSAAWTSDCTALTVAVVNPTRDAIRFPINIEGAQLTGRGTRWVITGPDEMAYNEPGGRTDVEIVESEVKRLRAYLKVPPMSVTLYRLNTR